MRWIRLAPIPRSRSALHVSALLLSSACLSLPLVCSAQQMHPSESQVKAAYLFNFGKFVRWQVNAAARSDSFEICVMGKNPFGSTLENTVAGESIDGKNIVARHITNLQDATHCRILFIGSSAESNLKSILGAARQSSVLTVSDIPGFAQSGGMIELVNQEGRIRFEVNLAAVGDAGLTVSSELLKVAVKVIGTNQAREMAR